VQDNRAPQIFNQLFTKLHPQANGCPETVRKAAITAADLTVEVLDILDGPQERSK